MLKRNKSKEILSAKELLRIDSINIRISKTTRGILILLASFIYLFLLIFGLLSVATGAPLIIKLSWVFLISLVFIIMLLIITKIIIRSSPLRMTERGIIIDPYLVELWEDIDSYGWETFKGLSKMSFSSKGEGTCLYILNKGTFQRNVETWTGHTMLAQYGIFFTPEQIQETEKIFQRFGIKKIAELDFKKADLETKAERSAFNVSRIVTQITLYVVIPTISMFVLYKLKLISIGFLPLLVFFGIIDIALISVIIWGAKIR